MPESKERIAINLENRKKRRHAEPARKLSNDMLRNLLAEASKDDKAETLKRILSELKPVLLELMKNKAWSSRKTAQFFKSRKIMARACDIEAFLKTNPFDESDSDALLELKRNISKTETKELEANEKRV